MLTTVGGMVNDAFGAWSSPLTARSLAVAGVRLGEPRYDGADLYWTEGRPAEGGRVALMRERAGAVEEVAPGQNVRSRVHEYGGGAWAARDGVVVISSDPTGQLLRVDGAEPIALTPPDRGWRYADLRVLPGAGLVLAVREDHSQPGEPVNTLVALRLEAPNDDGGVVLVAGADFYACAELSAGGRLAWMEWRHPDMPWDACELWLAEVQGDGSLNGAHRVAGGDDVSVQQPLWSPDGHLHYVSDAGGWWNLYRQHDGRAEALCPMAAEFGEAFWNLGLATYGFASAGEIVCVVTRDGRSRLARLPSGGGTPATIELPFSSFGSVAAADGQVLFTAASPLQANAVVRLDLADGRFDVLRQGSAIDIDADDTSVAEALRFPTTGGGDAHGFYYAPKNRAFEPLPGERPPLIVIGHGGPTSRALDAYRPAVQYWTSRGFAVLDVNYRGSTGFGRAYRRQLEGQWGIADVDDCVAGAQHLVARGDVDGQRLIIRGSSAGGFTTLAALAFRDTFACGASLYGIGDLQSLAEDTHKFESRYLDRLVGPWPAARALYEARSPIRHLDGLRCPLILLQGSDDKVVPPEQSRRMHAALKARGVPVAYLEFAGEQHGFRQAANLVRALDA